MIVWIAFAAALAVLHVVVPFWGWVMVVPLAWGARTARRRSRTALVGGAAMGAVVWGAGVAASWWNGGAAVAGRVAQTLAPVTGGRPVVLVAWTIGLGAIAASVAAVAGRAIAGRLRADGNPPA